MDDDCDPIGHCAWPDCPHATGQYVKMLYNCPMCTRPMFCNKECYWGGIEAHMLKCANRNHMHKELHRNRRGSLVTPRSVRSTLFDMMRMDDKMLRFLYCRAKQGEVKAKSLGILVWSIKSRGSLCTTLNWTERRDHAIKAGFTFVTCMSVSKNEDTDSKCKALMPGCVMRVHAIAQQEHNDVFVAVIYDEEEKTAASRLFTLLPINRLARAASLGGLQARRRE